MTGLIEKKVFIERLERPEIRPAVAFLLKKLIQDLGEDFLSLTVVGSALTKDFNPKHSDINTVLVVTQRSQDLLEILAGYGKSMGKKHLAAPLLMTKRYISESTDVFGVEFLDFQFNHCVVYGEDPFGELLFKKEQVRLQCEYRLKAALIQLRQGYIRQLGKPKAIAHLLMDCTRELAVILKALLWLVDIDRDNCILPNLIKAAQEFSFDSSVIAHLMELKIRHKLPESDQVKIIFEKTYQVIDHLAGKVDKMELEGFTPRV